MYLWSPFTFYTFWIGLFVCVAFAGVYVFVLLLMVGWAILWWYHVPQLPEERVTCVLGSINPTSDLEEEQCSPENTNCNSDEHCDGRSLTKPILVAHRGGAIDAPENTIEAFKLAKKNGAVAVEFDLEFTGDCYPIVMHDETLDRTTNGTGFVRDHTLEEILDLNAAAKHKHRASYGKVRVPQLEEAVMVCLQLKLKMFIDCKRSAAETVVVLSQLFTKYPNLYKEAIVCSFYPNIIYRVRKADPNILTALTHRHQIYSKCDMDGEERQKTFWRQIIARPIDIILEIGHYTFLWYLCGNSAFLMNRDTYSGLYHNFWKKRGVRVFVWTINDPYEKQYFLKTRQCSVITDSLL
ncbi:glycerophosphodiester phosphodiesterase 1 [Octopus sinensis]|uniref:Glycerophosphodiester phosphodiesterase 1 n=1 Tax=Octopus sinensis TaxID=2607531 RepID=A0A6P7S7C5_9MOLL|nr:glycerophosphodiester phosphodiesterase 1 [Octopus sinensis]